MSGALLTVLARSPRKSALAYAFVGLGLFAPLFVAKQSAAQPVPPPFDCRSMDPTKWPPSSKPYFMLAVDTSGSMTSCTDAAHSGSDTCAAGAVNNSCGYEPTRLNDAKCAVRKTVQAFGGEVNFGMMTYARILSGCNAGAVPDSCGTGAANNCNDEFYAANNCAVSNFANNMVNPGCGNLPDCGGTNTDNPQIYQGQIINGASVPPILGGGTVTMPGRNWLNGGNVVVDMLKDPTWAPATQPLTNSAALLEWVDGRTDNSHEIFASGYTPLEGILRTAHQYYGAGWASAWADNNYCTTAAGATINHASPIDPANDRICRSLNVILVTDGDETCNGTAPNAASALAKVGVVIQGVRVPVSTYVIGFAGATKASLDAIALAGGTTASYSANNEIQLAQALAGIIAGAVSPETCDNTDNNCNGCIDEGSQLYCNRNKTPTALATLQAAPTVDLSKCCNAAGGAAARTACLNAFAASITTTLPQGNQSLLPCWDAVADTTNIPSKWLCSDPGEVCDTKDNNCELQIDSTQAASFATNVVDENMLKCGSPAHCPIPETCEGTDQNCDNITDNAAGSGVPFSVCPNSCVPTGELCNGCDDDCDGIADNGIPDVPCGFSPPAACAGVSKCTPVAVAGPGLCMPGFTKPGTNRFGTCSGVGSTETCNGIDDNCDGIVDNNPTGTGGACTPNPGDPTIGGCKAGTRICQNGAFVCVGYIGPDTEICDGIDNDCDGLIDAADPDLTGVKKVCGSVQGRCTKGLTACVGGAIVCQGGNLPQPEICNGQDDDCNGVTDDSLTDTPAPLGCWSSPVSATCTTSCKAAGLTWCPPAGATCTGVGTLVGICKVGGLVCNGKWECHGDQGPLTEVCNAQDDDCNGATDEPGKLGPPIGTVCGQTVAGSPCKSGILKCVNGGQVCDGEVGPQTEICNGIDDDCDTRIDNGISLGGSCQADYDHIAYPGPERHGLECPPGVLQCDLAGGTPTCKGGQGPTPEVCDGKDNDCDGQIDESGDPPDGMNGSVDPNDPTRHIGDECGANQGECKPGHLTCIAGRIECIGSSGSTPEICDCKDNDCDGLIDEDALPSEQPLCSTGKTCVQKPTGGSCQCAPPCGGGEFPCPGGQECANPVNRSGTTTEEPTGFCLRPDACGNCATKTVKNGDGTIECAPTGSQPPSGRPIPPCVCSAGIACHGPCFGTAQCATGTDCAPLTGTCQPQDNCFFFGCPDGKACTANRACVDNPCVTTPCGPTEVCKPTADFSSRNCVGSCANLTCGAGQACVDGKCEPTGCGANCPTGQFCRPGVGDAGVGACGPNLCTPASCPQGEYCDPRTARCGANPCEGVVCPSGQSCQGGECLTAVKPPASTDGGPQGGATGAGGGSSSGGEQGTGATGPAVNPKAAFGLATGGGGCACSVPSSKSNSLPRGLLLGLAAVVAIRARRRPRLGAKGGVR